MPFDLTQTMGDSKMCQAHPFFPTLLFPLFYSPPFISLFPRKKRKRFPEKCTSWIDILLLFWMSRCLTCAGEETLNDVECFMAPCFCFSPSRCRSETLIGEPHLRLADQTAEEQRRAALNIQAALFQNATYLPQANVITEGRFKKKKKRNTHENSDCPAYGLQAVSIT